MFRESFLLCVCMYSLADSANGLYFPRKQPTPRDDGSFLKETFKTLMEDKMDLKIQQAVTKLKKELQKPKDKKIAFTAELRKKETYAHGQILKFTHIITSVGGGLSTTDGIFYCPESGIYVFFANIMTSTDSGAADIYKNNKWIEQIHTDSSGENLYYKTGSNMAILQLNKGDKVYVRSHNRGTFHPHASHFSGYKL